MGLSDLPATIEEIQQDPRCYLSKVTGKWQLEDAETGQEFEFLESVNQWIPVVDEAEVQQQQKIYQRKDESLKEQKKESDSPGKSETGKRKRETEVEPPTKKPKNSAIYLSGLPKDVTEDELDDIFSRFGVITEDLLLGKKKIKLYKDQEGCNKGDALIVYFKEESVDLAIHMMDGEPLRDGESNVISVQKADFSNKPAKPLSDTKKLSEAEKKKLQKRYIKLNKKLEEWDDDGTEGGGTWNRSSKVQKRWEKVVILKHMFKLQELQADASLEEDIKMDVLEGCEDVGQVTNVVVYDEEPEGVVSVKFANAEDARRCVEVMNGRFFDGQRIEAFIYDGRKRYKKKSLQAKESSGKTEEERLNEFGDWLEKEGSQA